MASDGQKPIGFECSAPILRVGSMEASVRFCVDKLGFKNAPWGNNDFTSVNRDRAGICLCRQGQGLGKAWVWIGVDDARVLHDEWRVRGIPIKLPPTNYAWALEFHIEDPDGNVLRLASAPE